MNMNCQVCDKMFTGIENFRQHEASEKHKRKVALHNAMRTDSSQLQQSDNSMSQALNTYHCSPCSRTFQDLSSFTQHSVSEEHALRIIEKGKENAEDGLLSGSSLSSTVKAESIKNDQCNGLVESASDNDSLSNRSKTVPSHSWSWCGTCEKSFSGPEPYQQHIDSYAHKKNCGLLAGTGSQVDGGCPTTCGLLVCELCNKRFSGPPCYQQHLKSDAHKKKVLASSNQANIVPANSGSAYSLLRCDICDKTFTGPISYDQHMKSENHKKVVERKRLMGQAIEKRESDELDSPISKNPIGSNQTSPWYCNICDITCSGQEPWNDHLKSKQHGKKSIRMGIESKNDTVRSLFPGPANQEMSTDVTKGNNVAMSSGDLGEEIQKSVFGSSSYIMNITPTNLELSYFKVDEKIDFDKNMTSHVEIDNFEMLDTDEGKNENGDSENSS